MPSLIALSTFSDVLKAPLYTVPAGVGGALVRPGDATESTATKLLNTHITPETIARDTVITSTPRHTTEAGLPTVETTKHTGTLHDNLTSEYEGVSSGKLPEKITSENEGVLLGILSDKLTTEYTGVPSGTLHNNLTSEHEGVSSGVSHNNLTSDYEGTLSETTHNNLTSDHAAGPSASATKDSLPISASATDPFASGASTADKAVGVHEAGLVDGEHHSQGIEGILETILGPKVAVPPTHLGEQCRDEDLNRNTTLI